VIVSCMSVAVAVASASLARYSIFAAHDKRIVLYAVERWTFPPSAYMQFYQCVYVHSQAHAASLLLSNKRNRLFY
jgi:hypothetical protein